ncbi:hypothetical protein [Sedimenticola sp.]|uniref:hypothetical protein n=1 Tax=Sedimenticola sp. TaxID=1940285 RepID=UPI0025848632|nr:hypothetical protein [Sedimenticola sp.]MCW8903098.1 hypothetical protein [Sedimenticola sp.]
MKFEVSDQESKKAKVPHEIFLTNLVGNHILWFIASLGLVRSYWQPLALVPVVSILLLGYTLWRARRSKAIDSWFVMCHWQLCAGRSRAFILTLSVFGFIAFLGWVGFTYFGMKEVAVMAMIGGAGVLPVMVTVLVLILMESDALHQATQHKLPNQMIERYPNPDIRAIEE